MCSEVSTKIPNKIRQNKEMIRLHLIEIIGTKIKEKNGQKNPINIKVKKERKKE